MEQQLEILESILEGNLVDNLKNEMDLKNKVIIKLIYSNFNEVELAEITAWMNREIYISETTINKLIMILEEKQQTLLLKKWTEKNIKKN